MKLIDKDAVLAIIEKFMYDANLEADIASTGECFDEKVADCKYQLCKSILDRINSLEVKKVDLEHLEQEVKDFCYEYDDRKDKWYDMTPHDKNIMVNPTWANFAMSIAKHFFELGLKASNPLTWEDIIIIHKCIKDAMNFKLYKMMEGIEGQKEVYEEVLKQFKEKKENRV